MTCTVAQGCIRRFSRRGGRRWCGRGHSGWRGCGSRGGSRSPGEYRSGGVAPAKAGSRASLGGGCSPRFAGGQIVTAETQAAGPGAPQLPTTRDEARPSDSGGLHAAQFVLQVLDLVADPGGDLKLQLGRGGVHLIGELLDQGDQVHARLTAARGRSGGGGTRPGKSVPPTVRSEGSETDPSCPPGQSTSSAGREWQTHSRC